MRHLKLSVTFGLVFVAMTGEALAAKVAHKRSPTVVTQNSDPDFLAMIGSVMPFSNDEAEKFRHGPTKPEANKYLNATPQPVRAQRTSASLDGGGETTPYGFPGAKYPDDAVGFYKDNFVNYSNSPLNGYYGWYGQISP